MGFFGKHTPWYTIESHKMGRIVKAFDTKRRKVGKDDKGAPKIREMVNWPISAGLAVGEESKYFFKWAE
jgi:NADH/NAD ratio-sensing transcriptional regulator Rex